MAATVLTVQTISEAGMTPVAPVNGDNVNGNSYSNSGTQWVEAVNGAAGTATYTVSFPNPVHGQTIPALSYTVAATGTYPVGSHRAGPFDPSIFGSTVTITPSASTLKLHVFQWTK